MPDFYSNFRELQSHEQEGIDYRINTSEVWHPVLIIAPHGGNIEPYTSQITQWIAGEDFAWYSFEGIKDVSCSKLHITSHNYDEPLLLQALRNAHTVLTIHGLKDSSAEFLMIGGLDTAFAGQLRVSLEQKGFIIRESEKPYRGIRPKNICNRGSTEKGIQLEISYTLRKRIVEDLVYRTCFVDAIRTQINARLSQMSGKIGGCSEEDTE